jgi:hypothetical protein
MSNIEKEIADKIVKTNGLSITKLGLRFDKVVTRLFANLREAVGSDCPKGTAVLLTMTAPIKLPAKTEQELKEQINDLLKAGIRDQDKKLTVFQNAARLRIVDTPSKQAAKFIGFVHNPDSNPKLLLDLAAEWIRSTN